ncbi:carbohydrate ABC transporter membrane protein 1, CUT1 family [Lachnospiraceae bacterium KH1T2]|nr:carbohydrate ABC transporter membrane protein 1, CUT1 family [Lachnospiraceae bacterium KH1T2]
MSNTGAVTNTAEWEQKCSHPEYKRIQMKKNALSKTIKYLQSAEGSAYIFIFPSIILLMMFNIIPLLAAFGLSFFDVPITLDSAKFIGIENFKTAFSDARFVNSLKVTAIFTAIEVPVQVIGAMIIAAFISENNLKNKFFRAIYFLPVICSATAIGIMWKMILHSNVGFFTYALSSMGLGRINFFNDTHMAIFTVAFISIWRSFGISAIIYVTAIQNVNGSLYEAAKMDGAGSLRQFIDVTVPSIRPTFWFILMTRFAGSLQIFDIIYMTTNGGPNYTTESTVTYVYSRAFSSGSQMGYASTMSVILFAVIMIVTVIMNKRMNSEDM